MSAIAREATDIARWKHQLESGISAMGIRLHDTQTEKLLQFVFLIEKWNRVHNLTAIRDMEKMISHHVLDSLAILPYITGKRILDVGSGAGLPGIPLAITQPDIEVTLIDSNSKKSAFQQQARADLQLDNVQSICTRVEAWHADPYDTIVSRAYSELTTFIEFSRHLLADQGTFVAMKGAFPQEEIAVLPASFRVRQSHRLEVPGLQAERHLILIEKS